ncbi:UDP-N-acetylmuramoyl-tripeptide--D-alanyl-D-alanine ligase [Zobellella sp. DQSA1]|uniref:UDP-N-acetylmuramoyl-tripeptide--D-alanyl-D- alanine ligase n=1 Tax=Zobellella sp. DQSA1 TaxID=3342386 RepID=UPI0035C0F5C7
MKIDNENKGDKIGEKSTSFTGGANWDTNRLSEATNGKWIIPPSSPSWRASGLCIHPPTMQPGQMVVIRPKDKAHYVTPAAAKLLPFSPQALIISDDDFPVEGDIPVLKVSDSRKAIINIGHYSRSQMKGKVIGVTGSSGKTTTVAMLHHVLRPWGEVGKTEHNANLPVGIAWNLASIPWGAPHIVMEMAIGNMPQNSSLVQPHIAIITNINAAHLKYHHSTEEIAKKKSKIFSKMPADGIAIANRDIKEWPIIEAEAKQNGLSLITFGQHPESNIRLVKYDPKSQHVHITHDNKNKIKFRLGSPGIHMAMNSLACLATIIALQLDIEPAIAMLPLFKPVPGRGEMFHLSLNGKALRVIDDAYNANPASMKAAMSLIRDLPLINSSGRKILVLGDMLELGDESDCLHKELVPYISETKADHVLLVGDHMTNISQEISDKNIQCTVFKDALSLKKDLFELLNDGDTVLFKSSNGVGLHKIIKEIRAIS